MRPTSVTEFAVDSECERCGTFTTLSSAGGYCTDCSLPVAPSFALPFVMVGSRSGYCTTAQRGRICTDSTCSKLHDVIRCEPCNCSFPSGSLQQHESGRQHLQNVASRRSRPSAPSQTAPTIQPAMPANISPPAGGGTSTRGTDPRVSVSGEGGLDFSVEGSGASTNPFFPPTTHKIRIEKTNMSSSLSLQAVALTPYLGSWCE
jgi:hypothetical protein